MIDPTEFYRRMLRIRRTEEAVAEAYPAKEMRCPVHLSIGQEAVAVGLCARLRAEDHVYSNHRCHAHYLAKGGDLRRMIAELFGRATGCAGGRGGSMHLIDVSVGMMGASALVAGTIPLAVGSALAGRLAVAFFGDGASEEGVFYESLNFAALRRLPVVFACENNGYATYSPQKARQATARIAQRATAFGIPSETVDGNDVEAVWEAAGRAVDRARSGGGPTLLEFLTCRWRDHVGPGWDFDVGYRSREEVERWMNRCPLRLLEKRVPAEDRAQIRVTVDAEIADAFAFARRSPFPDPRELTRNVYANPEVR